MVGQPKSALSCRTRSLAPAHVTPPPTSINGRREVRSTLTASAIASGLGCEAYSGR